MLMYDVWRLHMVSDIMSAAFTSLKYEVLASAVAALTASELFIVAGLACCSQAVVYVLGI